MWFHRFAKVTLSVCSLGPEAGRENCHDLAQHSLDEFQLTVRRWASRSTLRPVEGRRVVFMLHYQYIKSPRSFII
jgi:hypothetical protein